jgi:hypothetical protein
MGAPWDVLDVRPFLFWKALVRLNSLGNGLLLLELSSLTPGGSHRAADGNSILFIGKVVISQRKSRVARSDYLLK